MKKLAVLSFIVATLMLSLTAFQSSGHSSLRIIELTKENMIVIDSEITAESVSKAMDQAKILDASPSNAPIYVFLNTPGGSIEAGLNLIEYLNGLKRPVSTITLFAASMGFHMAQELGERYIVSSGTLMSHHARGAISGEMGGSAGSQMDKRFAYWNQKLGEMDQKVADRTKGKVSLEKYQAIYENELWLTGAQSVSQGFADEQVLVRCGDVGDDRRTSVEFMGMAMTVVVSGCPLDVSMKIEASGLTSDQERKAREYFNGIDLISYNKGHIVPLNILIK